MATGARHVRCLADRRLATTAGVALLCAVSGCAGSSGAASSGAPATVVCGQALSHSAAGAVLTDASQQGSYEVTDQTAGGAILLRLSTSCSKGASMQIAPPNALQVVAEAKSKDGRLAAVALLPKVTVADLSIVHFDGTSTTVHIQLPRLIASRG